MTAFARPSRLRLGQVGGVVVVLVVAGFGVALVAPFQWDDSDIILPLRDTQVVANIPRFFVPAYWADREESLRPYRPVREAHFALMRAVFGEEPAGWHVASLALHAGNAVLLYLFVALVLGREVTGRWAAILYAVHPVHVESVVWVKNAGELLAHGFALASGLLFVAAVCPEAAWRPRGRAGRRAAYVGAFALFLLALGAKEAAAVFPVILAGALLWRPVRIAAARPAVAIGALAPFLAAVAAYAALQFGMMGGKAHASLDAAQRRTTVVKLAHAVETVWRYAAMAAVPVDRHPWRAGLPPTRAVPWGRVTSLALAGLGVMALGWGVARRWRTAGIGLWWFLAGLGPAANLFAYNAGRPLAEQRAYLPLAGWCVVLATFLAALRRPGRYVAAALAVLFVTLCADYGWAWSSPRRLWLWGVRAEPTLAGPHCNLGNVYVSKDRPELGWAEHQTAARVEPDRPQVLNNLGVGRERAGDLEAAVRMYRRASALMPKEPKSRRNLAVVLVKLGRIEEALGELDILLRHNPDDVAGLNARADVLGRLGRYEEALNDLRSALRKEPNHADAIYAMARVHHILGRLPDAERFYRRAIEVRPDSALAWAGLGRVLASQQRLKAGLEAIERAIGLDQNLLEACHTRARIWSAMRRHAEAAEEYGRCVELAAAQETPLPERVDLLRAQARALTYAGQAEAARQAWRRLLDLAPQDPEAKKALEP